MSVAVPFDRMLERETPGKQIGNLARLAKFSCLAAIRGLGGGGDAGVGRSVLLLLEALNNEHDGGDDGTGTAVAAERAPLVGAEAAAGAGHGSQRTALGARRPVADEGPRLPRLPLRYFHGPRGL